MKAKVTKITRMDQKDTYGNTSFVVEFDNGEKGFYTSKNENQTKFVVGNVADYELEVKQGKKGPYNKITVHQTDGWKPGGKTPVDPRVSFVSMSMSYSKDLVVGGKVPLSDINVMAESMFNKMLQMYASIKSS